MASSVASTALHDHHEGRTPHGSFALLSFVALSAVTLCSTGAEALYADLVHVGRGPIALSWLVVVFPALVLNYLGQGAL